jgi:hypothetical protein
MPCLTAWLLTAALLAHEMADARAPGPPASTVASLTKVISISFTSSHRVLSDYVASYRRGGRLFDGPDFAPSRSHPITHTGGRLVEATVRLQTGRSIAAKTATVIGQVRGGDGFETGAFIGSGVVADGTITAEVRSTGALRKGAYRASLEVDWSVDFGQGPVGAGTTGPHVVYVTLGTPTSERDPNEDIVHRYPLPLPPGVTSKRMEAALTLIHKAEAARVTETHALVGKLMALFPGFLLAKGSHYVNDQGGAWLLADAVAESGECQAIVRLIKAVLDMVGAPGRLALVKLYADPKSPTAPIELPWGVAESPPPATQMKLVAIGEERRGWGVALLTDKPKFPDADAAKPDYGPCWKVGPVSAVTDRSRFLTEKPSNFQGALKVTVNGSTQYYGGGVGGAAFPSKEELFASAFWGMVWTMLVPFPLPERPAWDEKTAAAMQRIGISPTPAKGPTTRARSSPVEGFRLMAIIHIYGDDRCR